METNEMTKEKTIRLWCIAGKAVVRKDPDPDSEQIGTVLFGKSVKLNENSRAVNGRIEIQYQVGKEDKKQETITGWVNPAAFTRTEVEDYAKLYFQNKTGKRVPVAKRFHGNAEGFVNPNETVEMIAKVGAWCLTSRGWSKFKWFTKVRDIIDAEEMTTLIYGILARAVEDYRITVRRLKQHKHKGVDDFRQLMWQLDDLTEWFQSAEYNIMFDSVPGRERLNDLNEELMVDEKWLKEKHRVLEAIKDKKGRKRK